MIFLRVLPKKIYVALLLGGPRSSDPGSLNRLPEPPVPTPLGLMTLTFDVLTLELVRKVSHNAATFLPISVFLRVFVVE